MRRNRFFNLDGREVSEHEALVGGLLQDGFLLRVPTQFRDQSTVIRQHFRDRRQYWDAHCDELVVTDARRVNVGSNSPGFRLFDNDLGCTAKDIALREHERYLNDAWEGSAEIPTGAGEQPMRGSEEGDVCTCRGDDEYPQGAPGHLRKVNGALRCVPDDEDGADDDELRNAASDQRSVDQIAAEHRVRCDQILADHAAWLSNARRDGK
jgi:hypothetical protein